MAHHKINLRGKVGAYDFDPTIEFDGLKITVKAGAYTWKNKVYRIKEDESVLFDKNSDIGFKVQVRGFLVESNKPGDLELLVDEVSTNPKKGEEAYDWNNRNNNYTLIYDLFHFNLYPNSTDIFGEGAKTVSNSMGYRDGDFVSYHYIVPIDE